MPENNKGNSPTVLTCSKDEEGRLTADLTQGMDSNSFPAGSTMNMHLSEDMNGLTKATNDVRTAINGRPKHYRGVISQTFSGDYYHEDGQGGIVKNDAGGRAILDKANDLKASCNILAKNVKGHKFTIRSPQT